MFNLIMPFNGRLSRGGWWGYQVLIWILLLAGSVFVAIPEILNKAGVIDLPGTLGIGAMTVALLAIYMNFCTCLNRLRDTGRSGWWWLAFQLPLIGAVLMLYFCGIEKSGSVSRPERHEALTRELDEELDLAARPEYSDAWQPKAVQGNVPRIASSSPGGSSIRRPNIPPRTSRVSSQARPTFGRRGA